MQEVDPEYTRVSLETGERVLKQLQSGLASRDVVFRLQGSVPCNIHIRGVSDVDLLTLDDAFFTYDSSGVLAKAGFYKTPYGTPAVTALLSLRSEIESILSAKFYAAKVDKSGSKAVKISGGSLARPVDVVPSHWHNTSDYQSSYAEHDRGVKILNKDTSETLLNMPFRHIKLVTDRDENLCSRGLKKSVRLCKNVKADAIEDDKTINLSSFDITSTMYHADARALSAGAIYELGILAETQRWLDYLTINTSYAKTLKVPDGSRYIFDEDPKLDALRSLSVEMDDLLLEVAREQKAPYALDPSLFADGRKIVTESYIPYL